jgi:hypothetical protein
MGMEFKASDGLSGISVLPKGNDCHPDKINYLKIHQIQTGTKVELPGLDEAALSNPADGGIKLKNLPKPQGQGKVTHRGHHKHSESTKSANGASVIQDHDDVHPDTINRMEIYQISKESRSNLPAFDEAALGNLADGNKELKKFLRPEGREQITHTHRRHHSHGESSKTIDKSSIITDPKRQAVRK